MSACLQCGGGAILPSGICNTCWLQRFTDMVKAIPSEPYAYFDGDGYYIAAVGVVAGARVFVVAWGVAHRVQLRPVETFTGEATALCGRALSLLTDRLAFVVDQARVCPRCDELALGPVHPDDLPALTDEDAAEARALFRSLNGAVQGDLDEQASDDALEIT